MYYNHNFDMLMMRIKTTFNFQIRFKISSPSLKYDSSMGGDHLLVNYALLVKKSVAAADISLFNIWSVLLFLESIPLGFVWWI